MTWGRSFGEGIAQGDIAVMVEAIFDSPALADESEQRDRDP